MLSATTARLASICSHYSAPFWGKASPNCSDHLLRPTSRLMDCRGLQDGAQQSGAQRGAHGNGQLIHHSFGLHSLSHPKPSRPLAGLEKYQPKRGRHVATQRCCASATWYAKEWYAAWYARKRTFCVLLRAHCVRIDSPSRRAGHRPARGDSRSQCASGIHGLVSKQVSMKMSADGTDLETNNPRQPEPPRTHWCQSKRIICPQPAPRAVCRIRA
ncbi:Uncharacterised protein [Stutzerimonas stutzeri]|nr:Uncharacterised protein [Stutzerimonas stutzeri]CAB5601782.1 Uncharacterised protein [Stutzerimonas stutzeri]CAC9083403.1 Uncharacterised protein [Stutzerimonas stutzeri]